MIKLQHIFLALTIDTFYNWGMNISPLTQLIVGGGILTAVAGILFAAGKVVGTVEHLSKTVDNIDNRLRTVEGDLKDVQSKVTVLWEQREVL